MRFNVYIGAGITPYNWNCLEQDALDVILEAYAEGNISPFINGRKINMHDLRALKIFENDFDDETFETVRNTILRDRVSNSQLLSNLDVKYLDLSTVDYAKIGKEVTYKFIGHKPFGWRKGLTLVNNSEQLTNSFWDLFHDDIKKVAKPRFDAKQYADAVEASFKELNNMIKEEYKKEKGDEQDGKQLMQKAFSPNNPTFKLVDISTESGKNIQEGYMSIFAGCMAGIRNPKAHKNLIIDQSDAVEKIVLASHLLKIFEKRIL